MVSEIFVEVITAALNTFPEAFLQPGSQASKLLVLSPVEVLIS